ncbi:MAG TPA: hypothetical protein VFT79_04795 [Solirubrobacterales bacterium]|nr:hypothetical protein [Solirubrobacterales bacterium]
MARKDAIEKKLRKLRDLVQRGEEGDPVAFHAVPEGLAKEGADQLVFTAAEMEALTCLQEALAADPRFEHLKRSGKAQLVDFVARVQLEPETDHVAAFLEQYAKQPEHRTCYFPIESLALTEKVEVAGVTLLPMLEGENENLRISIAPDVKTIAAVPTEGTDLKLMGQRARSQAEHALRILRISLREDRTVHDYQLRFRLGDHYAFESGLGGWEAPGDVSWELELDAELVDLVRKGPLWTMPLRPSTKLERRIDRAMRWMDQAFLVGDELLELLFYFFALEALLGDKSAGLKAQMLAFRRALLGSVTRGHFAHPNQLALLYEEVRSAAVHGSEPPEVEARLLRAFAWDTRLALVEYVEFAQANDFRRPSKLFKALEVDPKRELLAKGLREKEPEVWGSFLDELEDG